MLLNQATEGVESERERGRRTLSTEHSGGWRTAETSGGFAVSGPGGGTGGGGHPEHR